MGIYESGKYIEVHPTFLYESLGTFIIFILLLLKSKNRKYKGEITLLYLMIYSVLRTFVEGLRTDSLMLGPLRISQILSIIIFIVSLVLYIKNIKTRKDN